MAIKVVRVKEKMGFRMIKVRKGKDYVYLFIWWGRRHLNIYLNYRPLKLGCQYLR